MSQQPQVPQTLLYVWVVGVCAAGTASTGKVRVRVDGLCAVHGIIRQAHAGVCARAPASTARTGSCSYWQRALRQYITSTPELTTAGFTLPWPPHLHPQAPVLRVLRVHADVDADTTWVTWLHHTSQVRAWDLRAELCRLCHTPFSLADCDTGSCCGELAAQLCLFR